MIVKARDTHAVEWTVNMDLADADVRLILKKDGGPPIVLEAVAAGSTVTHQLTGELPIGTYDVELEATIGAEIITFPNNGYASLTVLADLA